MWAATQGTENARLIMKEELLDSLKETPSNAPTSRKLTTHILGQIDELEKNCPTPDDDVLESLAGNWELLWTAQDRRSTEWRRNPLRALINPLENQAYSNNPDGQGRSNPFLPRPVQDRLERLGVERGSARSSQLVDLKKGRVRNVVTFRFPGREKRQATLFVDIDFKPNDDDLRRVDVRFHSVRLIVTKSRMDTNFPLGIFGPRGWLRTTYIDESIRITRGHKGSVFVLCRTASVPKEETDEGFESLDAA